MQAITSQKQRQRANRDLEQVERMVADLDRERNEAMAGFDRAASLLQKSADEIRSAMRAWDARDEKPADQQQKLEAVS